MGAWRIRLQTHARAATAGALALVVLVAAAVVWQTGLLSSGPGGDATETRTMADLARLRDEPGTPRACKEAVERLTEARSKHLLPPLDPRRGPSTTQYDRLGAAEALERANKDVELSCP